MADDERGEKRSLRAKWRERKANRAERAAQKAEGRARLWEARNQGDGQARTNSGARMRDRERERFAHFDAGRFRCDAVVQLRRGISGTPRRRQNWDLACRYGEV